MNLIEYEKQFKKILEGYNKNYPYDSDEYIDYVKLNQARIKRWNKTGKINPALIETIKNIDQPLNWILITEPWCGDAAHSHPFIVKLAKLNSKISLTFRNRDASNSEIDKYLTNGGKSIPILIVRDAHGKDLFIWGPRRPIEAQKIVMRQKKNTSINTEDKKRELQIWYNKDKGTSIQQELNGLLKDKI